MGVRVLVQYTPSLQMFSVIQAFILQTELPTSSEPNYRESGWDRVVSLPDLGSLHEVSLPLLYHFEGYYYQYLNTLQHFPLSINAISLWAVIISTIIITLLIISGNDE